MPDEFGIALDLYVSLHLCEDTYARQSPDEFGIALDLYVSLRYNFVREDGNIISTG